MNALRPLVPALLVLFSLEGSLFSQGSLTSGDVHDALIAPSLDVDTWTFAAAAGERVNLRVAETGLASPFAPGFQLLDPDGVWVASGGGSLVGTVTATTAKSGTYSVVVRDTSGGGAVQTGSYRLQFVKSPGGFVVPGGDEGGALTSGRNHAGAIYLGDLDAWSFTAAVGDRFQLRIAETGTLGGFAPHFEVVDPAGVWIASGSGATVGSVFLNASVGGTYTVVVRDGSGGESANSGTYSLHFVKTPDGFEVPAGDDGGALTSGANHAGTIHVGDLDPWSFTAAIGDRVQVRVCETGTLGGFAPYFEVIDPTGVWILSGGGGTVASSFFNADKAGTYTVIVRDNSGGDSSNSGTYQLHFVKVPGGFVVPEGDDGGALTNGGNHTGTIHVGDLDPWSFTATVGDRVQLRVCETGTLGGLAPYFEVIDPTGVWILSGGGGTVASSFFNAAKTGVYTVAVRDGSGGESASSGTYQLHFVKAPGGFIVPAGDQGGPLTSGAHHNGFIHVGDLDAWSIPAVAGNPLYFRLTETGTPGSFFPYMEVIDPTGVWTVTASGAVEGIVSHTAAKTGTYTLVIRDGAGGESANSATYRLYAANLAGGYLAWLNTYFAAQLGNLDTMAGTWGPDADPDADGVRNLAEYYLGRNPTVRESAAPLTQSLTQEALVCEFRRKAGTLAATGVVEWSTELQTWSSAGVIYDAPIPDGAFEIVRAYVPLQPGTKLFARLSVTATP